MSETMTDAPVKTIDATGKFLDPTKQLLQWLHKTKSDRLSLRNNTKGKNRFVWRQFRLAFIDDVEQPYAMCYECKTFVKYSGRTGTGGLVRHNCFRQNLAAMDYQEDRRSEQDQKAISPSPTRLEIEDLMLHNSSRLGYIPNYKGKSGVWNQFDIITVDDKPVNFASCKYCHNIVSYVSRTGTGSMTRHKCQQRKRPISPIQEMTTEDLSKRVKQERTDDDYAEISTPSPTNSSQPSTGDGNLADMHLKAFSQLLQANLQNCRDRPEPRSQLVCEAPENALRRQYMDLLRRSLGAFHALQDDVFFDLAQTFINIGAEYGKVDIRQILSQSNDVDSAFGAGND